MTKLSDLQDCASFSQIWHGEHSVSPWPDALENVLPAKFIADAQEEIISWPGYAPTQLRSLDEIAGQAGIGALLYKDESTRFGLGSFKALGGAYAVVNFLAKTLSEILGQSVSMSDVRDGKYAKEAAGITVATATDGNHGRSVAWGAKQAGCQCRIYIHREVSKGREEAMSAFGAKVIRVDGDYDESVRVAAKEAAENNWQIISDTSYDGYMDIPRQVMAGYTIMVREILEQAETPTHVFIQAGVGGLAAAVLAAFWIETGENRPRFIICESDRADCIFESMKNDRASHVAVEQETIMAGLSCGEISLIAWEILSRGASAVMTLPDNCVAPAMRYMAAHGIEAGECAVPGIITFLAASKNPVLKQKLALDEKSRVLIFGCEGATDREVYERIISGENT